MAELQLKKAHRGRAFIKIGMSAPSGGGKTASSLLLAYGLVKEAHPDWSDEQIWAHIAIVDTENGSGELYVNSVINNTKIGIYNAITLGAPFEAEKYIQAIDLCHDAGMEVCILDSTTHLWSGEGGLLEQQSNVAKRSGNSYTAWRDITPQHNRFVEKMLQTPIHIIATMRAKEEYAQEKDSNSGKTSVRKLGMEPEQRKGMQYEFTIFFEIDAQHTALGSKDRTGLFDQKFFTISTNTGREIMKWLETGTDAPVEVVKESHKASRETGIEELRGRVIALCTKLGGSKNPDLMAMLKQNTPDGKGNPNTVKDTSALIDLFAKLQDMEAQLKVVEEPELKMVEEPAV